MLRIHIYWLFVFFTFLNLLPAQNSQDSLEDFFIAIPIVYRTPETSWAFGAGAAYNFYHSSDTLGDRPSQLQLGGAYTLRDQILLYLPYQLYFKNNRFNLNGELGYYRYVYFFYGIGNETRVSNEETYLATYPRFKWEGLYGLSKNMFVGLTYDFDSYRISERRLHGILEEISPVGIFGGNVSEPGMIAIYDNRNNVFFPTEGLYAQFDLYAGLGGSFDQYSGWKFDLRNYATFSWGHTLAVRWNWESQFGDVPFFRLAALGGPKLQRGYLAGRFRDKKLSLLQFSYRIPLFWRFKMTIFSAYGTVDEEVFLPLKNGHFSYGVGLRILADKENQLHLRVDYARGEDQDGFYLTIGEAF